MCNVMWDWFLFDVIIMRGPAKCLYVPEPGRNGPVADEMGQIPTHFWHIIICLNRDAFVSKGYDIFAPPTILSM